MKSKRERMTATLVRRIGGMRTMLLIGLIESYPKRQHGDPDGWFKPDHAGLQKTMRIKPPVYWAMLLGLIERGLVSRAVDERGHNYRIDFGAIEVYCRLAWFQRFVDFWRELAAEIKRRVKA